MEKPEHRVLAAMSIGSVAAHLSVLNGTNTEGWIDRLNSLLFEEGLSIQRTRR